MDFSQEMINVLMQLGLNKQQISNQTTHKLVDYFVSEDGKEVAMKEALKCVDDMKTKLADLEHTYHELIGRVNDTCSTIRSCIAKEKVSRLNGSTVSFSPPVSRTIGTVPYLRLISCESPHGSNKDGIRKASEAA